MSIKMDIETGYFKNAADYISELHISLKTNGSLA